MKYCCQCANQLHLEVPVGDTLPRLVCSVCAWVFYDNPKIIVACTVIDSDRVLWLRRAIEPQKGLWALPSGFMEKGETLQGAACRELLEETGMEVDEDELELYSIGTLGIVDQVHVNFRVKYRGQAYLDKSDEALEVAFFSEADLPKAQLAYPVLNFSSQGFYKELRAKRFGIYVGEVKRSGDVRVSRAGQAVDDEIRELSSNNFIIRER